MDRVDCFDAGQQLQGSVVVGLGADFRVQAPYGFHVVVEHIGSGRQHRFQG